MDFSFLIASKKPYDDYARKSVDSICAIDTKLKYEIIICHQDEIRDSRVRWIKDDKLSGSCYAYNTCYKYSSGKYIFIFTDDAILHGDIYGTIDFLESDLFKNKKFKITTLPGMLRDKTSPINITKFEKEPSYPDILKLTDCYIICPPFNVPCFPIFSRETVDNFLGGILFHPSVKICHDWWLGAFLYFNGEPIVQYDKALIIGDPILAIPHEDLILEDTKVKFFGESYVNTYRIIKNYFKGMPYVYDEGKSYISEQEILKLKNERIYSIHLTRP